MLRRRVPLVLAAALLGLVALGPGRAQQPPEPAASPDLGGAWALAGWNMGVDPAAEPSYRGRVTLERREKDTYLVTWAVNGRENRGVGLFDPRSGVFAAGYAIGQSSGVAIYTLAGDRRSMDCVGTFQAKVGDVAHESWRRE